MFTLMRFKQKVELFKPFQGDKQFLETKLNQNKSNKEATVPSQQNSENGWLITQWLEISSEQWLFKSSALISSAVW